MIDLYHPPLTLTGLSGIVTTMPHRSVSRRRLVASLALALALTGCAASGDAAVDGRADALDARADDAGGDDTSSGPTCDTPDLGAGGAAFGTGDDGGCFTPLSPGAELEIVHGIQGGIHVMAAIGAFRAGGASQCAFSAELAIGDISVARFDAGHAQLRAVDPGGITGATPGFPLVFSSADASQYHGRDATLRGTITVAGTSHPLPPVLVHLVDPAIGGPSSGAPP